MSLSPFRPFSYFHPRQLVAGAARLLPFGTSSTPRIWIDNDDHRDAYLSVLGQAAASAGRIILHGVSTSTSIAPYTNVVPESDANAFGSGRIDEYNKAVLSGFHPTRCKLPSAVFKGHMTKPVSGLIADTTPLNMPAATTLLSETLTHCTPADPMIICLGGPHSVAADAYLQALAVSEAQAEEFLSKCVISALGHTLGSGDGYNEKCDAWASEITAELFTSVIWPYTEFGHETGSPAVPLSRVQSDLPESWLRGSIYTRDHPTNSLPGGYDIDGLVLVMVLDNLTTEGPKYVNSVARYSRTGSVTDPGSGGDPDKDIATYALDPDGNTYFVTSMTQSVGTDIWWEIMSDINAWMGGSVPTYGTVYTDDFTRANASTLGTGWSQLGTRNQHAIVSNAAGKSTNSDMWNTRSEAYSGDHFAEAQWVNNQGGTREESVAVRLSGSGTASNGYLLVTYQSSNIQAVRFSAGAKTVLLNVGGENPVAGDKLRLTAKGDVLGLWKSDSDPTHPMHVDGFRLFGVIQDDDITGGKPGLSSWIPSITNTPLLDNWRSGDIT